MDKSKRDRYLRRTYGISFKEWDFICQFYGYRCLYPNCTVLGDAYTLSVDHVYPDHLGGISHPKNYQPLCQYHNLYVKNGSYQDFRFDKGKRMLKELANSRENQPFQLALTLTSTRLIEPAHTDTSYHFQYGFDYVLSPNRQREVSYIKIWLAELEERKKGGWGLLSGDWGYLHSGPLGKGELEAKESKLVSRVKKIFEKQESFYVCPTENEPLGLEDELNKILSIFPAWFFPLMTRYSYLLTRWNDDCYPPIERTVYSNIPDLLLSAGKGQWYFKYGYISSLTEGTNDKKRAEELLNRMENRLEKSGT